MINEYRQHGVFAVSGILFTHTSERQKPHFFIRKICEAAINRQKIEVGNLNHVRDYGYAPEYVKIAYEMLQQNKPEDKIIGTGYLFKLRDFVKWAFEFEGLNYEDYITENINDNREEISICAAPAEGCETHGKELIQTIMKKLKDAKTI
jgi:GDPmannose 4,6-dehydratase